MKVFWSWQDDSPRKTNRQFIKAALEEAVAAIEGNYVAEDADRPELDHDTKGVAGAKEIVPTLMAKIAASAVFVADVTPIGTTAKGKALPNPNVMVELGWSLHKPGDDRQIYILNTANGWTADQLPFDIRHRRVLTYTLSETADGKASERVKKQLVRDLIGAIQVILREHLDEKAQAAPAVGRAAKADEPSIWDGGESGFKHMDSMGRDYWQEVNIPPGPRAYLRVIPTGWKAKPPSAAAIGRLDIYAAPDAFPGSNVGNFGVTSEGFVRYWVAREPGPPVRAEDVSMYFDATGEFWILHGSAVIEAGNGRRFLQLAWVFKGWATALRRIQWLLDHFGALPARRVEVGFTGMEDVRFPGGWHISSNPPARRNAWKLERTRRDWSNPAEQEAFLTEAFDEAFALFGLNSLSPAKKLEFVRENDPERGCQSPYH
ncbi:hypothetical protein [Bosea beijingensis]|uniref:hypothetical protein n=1 Tax=Bosea beijingensis TaxID=3068632 RepID=UPI0027424F0D|nr:hypothetical protein [Bosea sp. REN20]